MTLRTSSMNLWKWSDTMTTVASFSMLAGRVLTNVLMLVWNSFQNTSFSASPLSAAHSKHQANLTKTSYKRLAVHSAQMLKRRL